MQNSRSPEIRKLTSLLKKFIKNNVVDIFLIGSFVKNKLEPRDIDIIVLFKEKNLKDVENTFFSIKEEIGKKEVHLEPLFIDSFFKEPVFLSVIHEGFSIKNERTISDIMGLSAYTLFSFNLENLSKIDKVRFAQALYGRKKDGLVYTENGFILGSGTFMVPVDREEIFKELMKKWKIKHSTKKVFVNN